MASRRRLLQRFAFASHAVHHHRLGLRPVLEVLEGRVVLSTFTVNSVGDGGIGSGDEGDLRYCINQANADDQANTIVFDSIVFGTPQTITLNGGQLELSDTGGTQTITGPAAGVTISGGGTSRVFEIDSGVTASLSGLTISGGSTSSGNGGGLENNGTVTLTNCTVSGNSAYYGLVGNYGDYNIATGGGVLNASSANLTMTGCTVSGNSAGSGGGVQNSGTANLNDCTFTGNYAGGVSNYGTANLNNCVVSGNTASFGGVDNSGTANLTDCTLSGNDGSGVFNGGTANLTDCAISGNEDSGVSNGGTANLTDCTLSGNDFGGVSNGGTANLNDCTLSGNSANDGGGVFNGSNFDLIIVSSANLTMTGCTISGNSAGDGGGVFNFATANLTDCTVSGNSATNGGGVYILTGKANLTDCTVSDNDSSGRGGGLANYVLENYFPAGTVNLTDTIVAGNTDPSGASDIAGSDISGSDNLIGTGGSGGLVNGVNGNIVLTSLTNLGLAPLGNNGGPTQTMALLPGSAAIGAGVIADYPGTTTPITTDQRGYPLDTPNPDIGAYQTQGSSLIALTFSGISDQSITYGTPSVTISGTLANGSQAPVGETVAVTLGGVEQSATIGAGGGFSTTFDTSGLTVADSPYTITYAYTTDGTFASASTTSTLTVTSPMTIFTVNSVGDSPAGIGSNDAGDLRYCINQANADNQANTIVFDPTVFSTPQTITLNSGPLELSDTGGTQTITGPAVGVTISGGELGRVFEVDSGVTASLSGLTISGGTVSPGDNGGGLANYGTATLTGCTLSGNSASASYSYPKSSGGFGGGVFNAGTANLTLTDCTVSGNSSGGGLAGGYFGGLGGRDGGDGGGLANYGTATLTGCTLSGNSSPASYLYFHSFGGVGGGVFNSGTANLTLTDCTLSGNSSGGGRDEGGGGGLANYGTATLTGCTLSDNSAPSYNGYNNGLSGFGGGVFNSGTANLTLTGCTVSGNSAIGSGGGVSNSGYANLTLTDCALSGNSGYDGGGVLNGGTANLTDCALSGNTAGSGGGLLNGGMATLTGCTLSGNNAGYGGGLANRYATANLTDCTVSGNAGGFGGGVFNYIATANLTDCTVSGNAAAPGGGGGLANYGYGNIPAGPATLTNTIVAGNTSSVGASDIAGTNVSGSDNLIGTGGSGGLTNGVDGNIVLTSLTELGLAPLGNNGGPTQTLALLPGSPAIGAGVIADYPGTTTPITTDQRGLPLDSPNPDIGAFQTQGSPLIALTFSGISDPSITYGTSSVTISGTLADGSQAPVGETIAVTLDGVEQSATIGSDGAFSTTFNADGLTVTGSPDTVNYAYTSDGTFASATMSSSLTITPATLTITANPETKVYGTADPALAYTASGFAFSDTAASVLTGNLARAESGTLAGEEVGDYAITQDTLAADSNYTIAFTGSTLTINPATLTVTANPQTKVYGTEDPRLTDSATGLIDTSVDGVAIDDTAATVLTGALARAQSGTLAGEQVGDYAIAQGTLAANSNYTIAFTGSRLAVTPAPLTVTADSQTEVYGAADPSLTDTVSGLINTTVDGVTIDDTAASALTGHLARAAGETVSGGPYAITQGTLAASNYTMTFTGNTLTITPATLTIVAGPETKVFGSPDPTLGYTSSGFQFSDTAATVLTGSLARAAGETVSDSPYAIGQGTLTADSNYTIHFTSSSLGITPATPAVTVSDPGGTYAGSPIAATASVTGVNGPAARSLEGVMPTLTYYAGTGTSGTDLGSAAPSAAATYTVVARFPGSADYAAAHSESAAFVIAPAAATILLTSPISSPVYGQAVTFVATVNSAGGAPVGTVTFADGATPLATVPLDGSGQAAVTISTLSLGSHAITATYNGSTDFLDVKSSTAAESVSQAATGIVLVPPVVLKGKKTLKRFVLTAEIEPVVPGGMVPTGQVTFEFVKKHGKKVTVKTLGTAELSDGEATLTFKSNQMLKKPLTIVYSGDPDYLASTMSAPKLTKSAIASSGI